MALVRYGSRQAEPPKKHGAGLVAPAAIETAEPTLPAERIRPPIARARPPSRATLAPSSAPAPAPLDEAIATNEARFAVEPTDRARAGETEHALREGVRHLDVEGVDVGEVECRSSICRMPVHYAAAATLASSGRSQPRALFDRLCIGPESTWASLHVGCFLGAPSTASDGGGDSALFVFRDGKT